MDLDVNNDGGKTATTPVTTTTTTEQPTPKPTIRGIELESMPQKPVKN